MIKLVVGLGNPGQKYAKNRHNAGFLLLDKLKTGSADFSPKNRFFGELAEMRLEGRSLYLLKPATFMNRSGQSVSAVMKYYKVRSKEVLVLHDELDFELGVLKLKLGGGHGGHNGLRDIIAVTGSNDFLRLRLGIGRPQGAQAVADYVLSDFSRQDFELLMSRVADFQAVMPLLMTGDTESAMQALHS